MSNCLLKKLFLLLGLASVCSCQPKYGVLEYYPLQEFEFSSDPQVFSFDVEDIVHTIVINYWEGGKEVREQQSAQSSLVKHATVGPKIYEELHFDGGWFTILATNDPLRLEVDMDKNEGDQRHIELWVDMVGRTAAGKIKNSKAGPGYRIDLHQASGEKAE